MLPPPSFGPPLLQGGDGFDLSVILASLLIGVGYNAYVVSGGGVDKCG